MKESHVQHIRLMRHELRTPINQIIGYTELLQEEAEDRDQTCFIPDLQKIGEAAKNLLAVVDSIFDLDSTPKKTASSAPVTAAEVPETGRRPDAEHGDEIAEPAHPGSMRHGTLLVVDDDEKNRDFLSRRLRKNGYTVDAAGDGRQALEKLEAGRFDLVLLDVLMPEVGGLEVLRKVRETRSATDLPVIMATAVDASEDIVHALQIGANDYVTKPLDFPVVLARVETHLAIKRMMNEIQRLAEQLELRNVFIRKTFGRYISNEVVDTILSAPEALHLGGEKRRVTVLISDLRGFSSVSESLAPAEVIALLNNYFGVMTEIVSRHKGIVNEFVGDELLVIFGAPVQRRDDAERAAACALEMQLAMARVNEWNREHGLPEIEMGIGINTGEVIAGNLGSRERTKYCVVGAAVNLASRVESYTLGGQILLSPETLREIEPLAQLEGNITVTPKGMAEPITLHQLGGLGGKHNLRLPSKEEQFLALPEEAPLRYHVLEGKHCREESFAGTLVKLSKESAQIRLEKALPRMTNIKLVLLTSDCKTVPGAIYAKVLGEEPEDPTCFRVGLTFVAPEAGKVLDMLRARD